MGVAAYSVFRVIPVVIVPLAANTALVASEENYARLWLVGIDLMERVEISCQLCVMASLEFIEIGCRRLDAASANNEVRFSL